MRPNQRMAHKARSTLILLRIVSKRPEGQPTCGKTAPIGGLWVYACVATKMVTYRLFALEAFWIESVFSGAKGGLKTS